MVSFTKVDAKYALETSSPKLGGDVTINPDLKFRLDSDLKAGETVIKATAGKFTATCALKKKDVEVTYKNGNLSIKQKIPEGKTYLIPSPVVNYTKSIGDGWTLGTEYNFDARVGLVQGTYQFGAEDQYKADFGLKSNQARWLKLQFAPKDGATAARLTLCSMTGATLRLEAKPAADLTLNAEARTSGAASLTGTLRPPIGDGGLRLVLEAGVSGRLGDKGAAPRATTSVGLQWTP